MLTDSQVAVPAGGNVVAPGETEGPAIAESEKKVASTPAPAAL